MKYSRNGRSITADLAIPECEPHVLEVQIWTWNPFSGSRRYAGVSQKISPNRFILHTVEILVR
jgi:hypothetical protein